MIAHVQPTEDLVLQFFLKVCGAHQVALVVVLTRWRWCQSYQTAPVGSGNLQTVAMWRYITNFIKLDLRITLERIREYLDMTILP